MARSGCIGVAMAMEHPRMKNLRLATQLPIRIRTRVPKSNAWHGPTVIPARGSHLRRVRQIEKLGPRLWLPAGIAASLMILGFFMGSLTAMLILPSALVATYCVFRGEGGDLAILGLLAMLAGVLVCLVKAG